MGRGKGRSDMIYVLYGTVGVALASACSVLLLLWGFTLFARDRGDNDQEYHYDLREVDEDEESNAR